MINSTVTTKISAAFLAIVLVTGTITLAFPSFIVGTAQASSDRERDRDNDDDKKSNGKDDISKSTDNNVIVKEVKCNNINVNVNGLELMYCLLSLMDGST
jgi:hypothetical protein